MPPHSARVEALAISRYLVNRDCPEEMVERYERGRAAIGDGRWDADDVSAFAFRHHWSLSFLDAASPFVRGGESLRERVLLMAAILETSPVFASEFLPRDPDRGRLLIELARHGLMAGARLAIGVPLMLLVRRGA
jgi:hypothetical protein